MKLLNISKEEYLEFALKHPDISIYQLPEWGELKQTNGWEPHLVGLFDDAEKLVGTSLLLAKNTPIKKRLFYAPRGFLLDMNDASLFASFVKELKLYIQKHKGFMLKVDPNVIYKLRDNDGNEVRTINEDAFTNLTNNGFKHLGFTLNFETLQPRFLCRFPLGEDYESTLKTFHKSTRKNIEKINNDYIKVRTIDESEISNFVNILGASADSNDFVIRPTSYYEKMYTLMKEYLRLYIVSIDTNAYYDYVTKAIEDTQKEKNELEEHAKKINVGNKIKTQLEQLTNKLVKLEGELAKASKLKDSNASIDIGALMSIFIGDEGITFMSGTIPEYKEFNPKYAYYNFHIRSCLKEGKKYCNFYGISGDMNPKNPYYSMYEIKKGFNTEILELLGEFDLIINRFYYILYKVALKVYKKVK